MKHQNFLESLAYIVDDKLREVAVKLLDSLPDYFFTISSSSTNNHHPKFALGDGGLVRHTKAAAKIANDLFGLEQHQLEFTRREMDLMMIAILCHDGYKRGWPEKKHTEFTHPIIAANKILDEAIKYLPEKDAGFISSCIACHMGQWNDNAFDDDTLLDKPKTKYEKFVHLCDYLSSRDYLEIKL